MTVPDDLSGQVVNLGDRVRIAMNRNPSVLIEGNVAHVTSGKSQDAVLVVLKDGHSGVVIALLDDSDETVKRRIMSEDQHTENKEVFGEPVMCNEVIPKTVQSFLNSDGGYLYIGIRDIGSLQECLVGIHTDFELIKKGWKVDGVEKMCDRLELRIRSSLAKYLASDVQLDPLIDIKFPEIEGVQIVEISISRSERPWFYKNLNRKGNEVQFQLSYGKNDCGLRVLDDFYIRAGNRKKRLDTLREFYQYSRDRFINPQYPNEA